MGTQFYAAPEQAGFGMRSSTGKTDVYAVGMLLNVMITGCFPKEKRATGDVWNVIERCICMEAEQRYTAAELLHALEGIEMTNE
jgi:serine/threonine protein kinase